jgi:hypothetical protein
MRKVLAAFALALAAVSAVPTARADSSVEILAVRFVEELAAVIEANKGDCDKMGGALTKFIDDHEGDIRRLREAEKKMTEEQKKALASKYAARLQAAAGRILAGTLACEKNEKVKEALSRLRP